VHRDLQPFESIEAVVATPFGLAELEPVDAVGELLEHRPDLLLGQSGADAPVDAASEREVVGRVTANVEPIGIRKAFARHLWRSRTATRLEPPRGGARRRCRRPGS
jgi:hypothetical protein